MPNIGPLEILVVLVIFGVPAASVALIVVLVKQQSRKSGAGTPGAAPPAGWYADPYQQARLRYWDGYRWTEHIES